MRRRRSLWRAVHDRHDVRELCHAVRRRASSRPQHWARRRGNLRSIPIALFDKLILRQELRRLTWPARNNPPDPSPQQPAASRIRLRPPKVPNRGNRSGPNKLFAAGQRTRRDHPLSGAVADRRAPARICRRRRYREANRCVLRPGSEHRGVHRHHDDGRGAADGARFREAAGAAQAERECGMNRHHPRKLSADCSQRRSAKGNDGRCPGLARKRTRH